LHGRNVWEAGKGDCWRCHALLGQCARFTHVHGKPQQVKDDVKEIIDIFGDNGGLIVGSTMGLLDESREENVEALIEAVREYGVY
jgi:uroporphyrinogen-III decarboxylase